MTDTKHEEYDPGYNPVSNVKSTREVYTEKLVYGKQTKVTERRKWLSKKISIFSGTVDRVRKNERFYYHFSW